jgi:hypothetical protein
MRAVPPSDDKANPFERSSAWPKMPQAPFRIGALPKAGAPVPPPSAPPAPQAPPAGIIAAPQPRVTTDTSVPGYFGSGPMGAVTHGAAFLTGARQPAAPAPEVTAEPPAPANDPPPAAPPVVETAPFEPPTMQVAEVEVIARKRAPPEDAFDRPATAEPLFIPRADTAGPRRSRWPLIAAGLVVVLGLGALAAVLATRGQLPWPTSAPTLATPPPAAAPQLAAPPPSPPPPAAAPQDEITSTPLPPAAPAPALAAAAAVEPRPAGRVAAARRRASSPLPAAVVETPAPPAAVAPPVPETPPPTLVVPAAPPVVQAPPAPPRRPLPSDPSAPIPTKPNYSE